MKIVHISDSDSGGGAAHAMSRLHEALQRLGVDSRVLVRTSAAAGNAVETIATRGDADDLFPAVREAVVRQYVELNRTGITNTHFSLHIDGVDVSRMPVVASSDIVHLHWTASFQTPADVRALLDVKPVVWTLHDVEPLTGGCHFPVDCGGYLDDCAGCPQLLHDPFRVTATTLRDKKSLWAGGRPTFVAPSRYMADCARRSAVAHHAGASVVHIPHGIDIEAFRPRSKAAARSALGVPVDGLYVLCGSNHNGETRKGLRFLGRVLAAAKTGATDPSELKLLTVGEPKLDLHGLDGTDVFQLGRLPLDMMPMVYAAADVFLHPSVEDNFPCMLLESLSCGTPAIAFDIGGIADIVQDEVCGRLVAAGDELAMAAALSSLVRDRHMLHGMSERARAHVEEHFSDISIARKHAELYEDVAKNRAAHGAAAGRPRKSGLEEIFPRWSTACLVQELAVAHGRASQLVEESRAKSEHIAALEREIPALSLSSADQHRQVQEKEAERAAIHEIAVERKALAENLHASAASIEALAANLQEEVHDRDDALAKLAMVIDDQRAEIELVHRIAAERGLRIDELHRSAESLTLSLAVQSRQVQEKEVALTAIHAVAEERGALAATLQEEVHERDTILVNREAAMDEQRTEIEVVHRVAAERESRIEDLHRAAESLALSLAEQYRQVQEKEVELAAIHEIAEERNALVESLHAAAARTEAVAASLHELLRERDALLATFTATMHEQRAEIEMVHRIADDRRLLIEDLHRVAQERAAIIDGLSVLASAQSGHAEAVVPVSSGVS